MKLRSLVLLLLFLTVAAPILLYTHTFNTPSSKRDFLDDGSSLTFSADATRLNLLPQETQTAFKGPVGVFYSEKSADSSSNGVGSLSRTPETKEHISTRVLSATGDVDQPRNDSPIKQVTDVIMLRQIPGKPDAAVGMNKPIHDQDPRDSHTAFSQTSDGSSQNKETLHGAFTVQASGKVDQQKPTNVRAEKQRGNQAIQDARVKHFKDQLIRAKVYSSLPAAKANPHFVKELRLRSKEVLRALGDASKDSDLPKNADEKLRAMEQTLAKGKQIQDDCSAMVKKLRAMLHLTEEQLRVHKKQTTFLTQLTAKTIPKGLHCLPLRLTSEYYALSSSQQQFPEQEKLEDPQLYHYAIFSDNILAAAVVVNSTVTNAKHPSKQVFHIVTDRLNYAAMRMWFLANPPGKAAIQVQNVEEFTWLNSSYSPVLRQLGSPSMIDYYFRAHRVNSDSNLKFRNPKYLSILNHLRFYLPEIFPKLNKVLFLDDDIVVQKDLSGLWSVDLKGNVNGAVETCGESFHRFDRYLNFSHPLISKNFDPRACGWAYGMNVFDLDEWRRQNITEVYHRWQNLNHDRQLWKLGTLPPGLITFWNRTYPLNRNWHVLGLGYNPSVNPRDIERAAVIHYNGNLKPWLEIGMPRYRGYWSKYVDYDHLYLRECNINP